MWVHACTPEIDTNKVSLGFILKIVLHTTDVYLWLYTFVTHCNVLYKIYKHAINTFLLATKHFLVHAQVFVLDE